MKGGLCYKTCTVNHLDAEIFEPPYLFNLDGTLATRPIIQWAPITLRSGDTITVTMDNNDSETIFALVHTSMVTHSMNLDQRRIPLVAVENARNGSTFTLQIPKNKNVLLPRAYFLFAMNSDGTPSVGWTMYAGDVE